ncbi:MAG: GMP synthase subunit A [Methanomicrobiales archaeon]|nr:GMP synthase subunit A [Methanomicrobiales archaeon]NYT21558.1 GMP synthase subunit A [Methanomicrobiales archaeon]
MLPIYVVNNHGQFNHLIQRMLRDLGIDARMIANTTPPEEVASGCRGMILGGGPSMERAGNAGQYLDLGLPVLGICLGLHIITATFGGTVRPGRSGGYGPIDVVIREHDEILKGYPSRIKVWASHADEVAVPPKGAVTLATSPVCENEAIAIPDRRIYGLQWHPEVSHSENGRLVYENFNRITLEFGSS